METNKTKTVFIERNKLFKGLNMMMLNNINEVDESFVEDNMEVFFSECEACDGTGEVKNPDESPNAEGSIKCEECYGEGRFDSEPYQYFLVDANEWDIERLKEYGVQLAYSNKLDKHVLPIFDYGTSWSAFSYSKEVPEDYELSFDETLTRSTHY